MEQLIEFIKANALLIVVITIWDIIWRGMALWNSAKRNESVWFVALLIINSLGILPIIYLLIKRKAELK
jgi:hypothetical protein